MAFQPVFNAGQVVVRGTLASGGAMVNVFGVRLQEVLTQELTNTIGESMADAIAHLTGGQNTGVAWTGCEVTDLRSEDGEQFSDTANFPLLGTDPSNELPEQVAMLVSWKTGIRGRSFRGRTYLGGFVEEFAQGRFPSPELIASGVAYLNEILNASPAFGVISRRDHGALRELAILTEFVSGTVEPTWRTQRRRAG